MHRGNHKFCKRYEPDDGYMRLVQEFPLRSIKTEEECMAASEICCRLASQPLLSVSEMTYLDALSDLIAFFEIQEFEKQGLDEQLSAAEEDVYYGRLHDHEDVRREFFFDN